MWRFADLLGIDPPATGGFGEGDTPLLDAVSDALTGAGQPSISFKAEHQNPTGSFKDRTAAMAASMIERDGLHGAVGTSSGNGGAAIAAFGARGDFPVLLFTVTDIVDGKLHQILAHGSRTHIVAEFGAAFDGIEGVADAIDAIALQEGWLAFLTGARYAPEMMRGAETIAFELAEQRPGATAVYVPIGGGGLLASIWRGYRRVGVTPPRLIGVQPSGCPTLQRALGGDISELADPLTTTISGLQVPVLFDLDAPTAISASEGHVVEVSDQKIWDAQALLARREGLYAEPAGATALAGVLADRESGQLVPDDDVVVILSGAGHKDPRSAIRLGEGNEPRRIGVDDIQAVLAQLGGRS